MFQQCITNAQEKVKDKVRNSEICSETVTEITLTPNANKITRSHGIYHLKAAHSRLH